MVNNEFIDKKIDNTDYRIKLLYGQINTEALCEYINEYTVLLSEGLENIVVPLSRILFDQNQRFLRQMVIPGRTMRDYIMYSTACDSVVKLYKVVLRDILRLYSNYSMINVDTNLENFIVNGEKVYLVDTLPPILLDRVMQNYNVDPLYKLFCNRDYHLVSFMYYCLKAVVMNPKFDSYQKQKNVFCMMDFFYSCTSISIGEYNRPFHSYLSDLLSSLLNSEWATNRFETNSFRSFLKREGVCDGFTD